jgi:hypothetical protein
MARAADKLVTPWECPSKDCGSSAVTATEMVNVFGHYYTAADPEIYTFFKTCGACNKDVEGVRCVDCPESADTHEEAQIKFGEDYAEEERKVTKGRKTGLRCLECLEEFENKKQKNKPEGKKKKTPVKKNAKKGAKREQPTPSASSDSGDEGDDSKSGKAAESKSNKSPKRPPPSPQKKTPRKTVAKKK